MTEAALRPIKHMGPLRESSFAAPHDLYGAQPTERIDLIRAGIGAADAKRWLDMPNLGRARALKALDLPVATFNKKVKVNGKLSPAESERVVGFARLIGQVEALVHESDASLHFDARAWLARWLTEPLPALAGAKPIEFMDTMEGQALVSRHLAQMVSGAYA